MAVTKGPDARPPLRKFDTLKGRSDGGGEESSSSGAVGAGAAAHSPPPPATSWGLHTVLSSRFDLPTTSLILHCVAAASHNSATLKGFDREQGGSGRKAGQQAGCLAAALASHLVPGWWAVTRAPFWRWQLQTLLESPCFGVPGICRYTAARATWLAQQVQLSVDADGCRQVVVLRAGLGTLSHTLAQHGVKFFEVDSRLEVARKKAALDAVLPGWRRAAARPRLVEVDLLGGSLDLITHLTAAGFDPTRRCCVVAEGLLHFLPAKQCHSLLADLAALTAPGSRLLFDFLHADALQGGGSDLPGFASLAASVAAKGNPLQSGLLPAFSALVRHLQPHSFRLASLVPPLEVARLSLHATSAAASASAGQGTQIASSPIAKPQPAPSSLPYVPTYFSFASAVKTDPRLLLRHAEAPPGDQLSGGALLPNSTAALSSPYCIIRSLAYLLGLGGSRSAITALGNSCSSNSSSGGHVGMEALTPAPSTPPADACLPAATAAAPAAATEVPLRQQSWAIAAAALVEAAGGVSPDEPPCMPGSPDMPATTQKLSPAPSASRSTLQTAVSVGPQGLPVSVPGRRTSSGTGTGSSSQGGEDSGHLVAGSTATGADACASQEISTELSVFSVFF